MKIRLNFVLYGAGFGGLTILSLLLLVNLLNVQLLETSFEPLMFNRVLLFLWVLEIVLVSVALFFFHQILIYKIPSNLRVAVYGFPRSGKTTLLTRLLCSNYDNVQMDLDKSTSDVLRPNQKNLETGRSLASTTNQEVQPYIATIELGGFPFRRVYRVEFGEFPGTETTEILNGEDWNKSPLYEWGINAEAYLFVIDLGAYLLDNYGDLNIRSKKIYGPEYQNQIMKVWDYLKQDVGKNTINKRKVLLVFTKVDLLEAIAITDSAERTKFITENGYSDSIKLSYQLDLDNEIIERESSKIENNFRDLEKYFTNSLGKKKFYKLFVSCVKRERITDEFYSMRKLLLNLFE